MKLSPMKDKTKWAFIELVSSGNCVFFHLCPSFDQALNNSAYTLLSICDVNNNKAFRKAYNNVVALLG